MAARTYTLSSREDYDDQEEGFLEGDYDNDLGEEVEAGSREASRECSYESDEYDEFGDKGSESSSSTCNKKCCLQTCCGCLCCWSCLFLLFLFIGLPAIVGYITTQRHNKWAESFYADCPGYPETTTLCTSGKLLTPTIATRYLTWGGCKAGYKTDAQLQQCSTPCLTPSTIRTVDDFNMNHQSTLVSFSSRAHPTAPTVTLKAWWLPSGKANAPRIVLQHGNNANANSRYPFFAAYLLRSMGFDVLIPNLRNHGLSDTSVPYKTTWVYEYPYDLLGAWDFAVKDPNNLIGGATTADKVGIMGFSMGGMIVNSAFGIEPQVPAAWSDGAVYDLGLETGFQLHGYLGRALGDLIGHMSLWWMHKWTGVDVLAYEPSKVLPTGPDTQRPVAVVTSIEDDFVPYAQTEMYLNLFRSYPTKYSLTSIHPATACNGNGHCSFELILTNSYRENLCKFWTAAFSLPMSYCDLASLPSFR